jgi:hypothetical protein
MFQTSYRENETYFFFRTFFENRVIYEKIWKNILEPGRQQKTIWHMCFVCWILKATNTQTEYVALIALTLQQRLQERALVYPYMCIACRK